MKTLGQTRTAGFGRPAAALRALALSCGLWLAALAAYAAPAAEGTRLLEALEQGPVAVVGRIAEVRTLDRHGRAAQLVIESALVGSPPAGGPLSIAWEELSPTRPARFADGDRVLVCLEALPGASLWRTRIPDGRERVRTLAVAERGNAFLRDPGAGDLRLLDHYLRLAPALRKGPTGSRHLAALAAGGAPSLSVSAARQLTRDGVVLDEATGDLVLRALLRDAAEPADDRLAPLLLPWIGRAKPDPLRAPLAARLAAPGTVPAVLYVVQGLLDGALPAASQTRLLASESAADREAAARFASGATLDELPRVLRSDPAPQVREAALRRLLAVRGQDALDPALEALSDRDEKVRGAAATSLAGLGAAAVPRLLDVARDWPDPAPRMAVASLSLMRSPESGVALTDIAETHSDPAVRILARLALGLPVGHQD